MSKFPSVLTCPNGFIRSVACTHFMREKASLKVDDTEILPPFGRLNDMWWYSLKER